MSDLTNQEKLEEVYRLSVENNHMLHSMQQRERIGLVFRVIYWLAILGVLGGVYYYIRPVAEAVMRQFNEMKISFPEAKAFQQILQQIQSQGMSKPSTPDSNAPTNG